MDTIRVTNLELSGIHGLTQKEREAPQRFLIDIEIGYHQPLAGQTDNVIHALDYRQPRKIAAEVISGPRGDLLEMLVEKIASRILAETKALTVKVSIKKLDIWPNSQPVVEITRARVPARLDLKGFDLEGVMADLVNYGVASVPMLPEERRQKLWAEALDQQYVERPEYFPSSSVKQELFGCDSLRTDSGFARLSDDFTELLRCKFAASSFRTAEVFSQPLGFTDLSLQRYSAGSIGITPHRDGPSFINLIVIFLLGGEGKFALCDDREGNNPRYLDTTPGNVILMRAPGFLGSSYQPFHFVSDIATERITFGLRQKKITPLISKGESL